MADTAKILLAEDDTDMRRFLVKALQNVGENGGVGGSKRRNEQRRAGK